MDSATPVRQQVDQLVVMYKEYKALQTRQVDYRRQLAKAKLRGDDTTQLQAEYDDLTKQMQVISDEMTYSSPSVWILYKYEAYADDAQSIRTMQDFRQHCSKPGYICTKRFDFLNAQLTQRSIEPLTNNVVFPDSMLLTDILPAMNDIESDGRFMHQWGLHEYYQDGDRVAKWENI